MLESHASVSETTVGQSEQGWGASQGVVVIEHVGGGRDIEHVLRMMLCWDAYWIIHSVKGLGGVVMMTVILID